MKATEHVCDPQRTAELTNYVLMAISNSKNNTLGCALVKQRTYLDQSVSVKYTQARRMTKHVPKNQQHMGASHRSLY